MPVEGRGAALALLAVFAGVATAAGAGTAWIVGPRRPWAFLVPVGGALASLWLTGHRLGLRVGPTIPLFGFQVAFLGDVATALIGATAGALGQRWLYRRLRRAPASARGEAAPGRGPAVPRR